MKDWYYLKEPARFFRSGDKKFESPIKCLFENVDKHIKIGLAQIYRKKNARLASCVLTHRGRTFAVRRQTTPV